MADDRDWAAEVARVIDDHEPGEGPYGAMTRDQLEILMKSGAYDDDPAEYERINQHFLDHCTAAELDRINFGHELAAWLMRRRKAGGPEQSRHCIEVAGEATRRLFEDMPPPGPLHEIN